MNRNIPKALGKPKAIIKARDKPSSDRSSLWQAKYGSRSSNSDPTSIQFLDHFLPKQQKLEDVSSIATKPPGSYFESIPIDCTSIEQDAVDVISQMNSLLNGKFEATQLSRSVNIFDQKVTGQNNNARDDDFEYNNNTTFLDSHNLQLLTPSCAPVISVNDTANHEEDFSGEAMAILFRRSHDENQLKKCFGCLRLLTTANKQLRCQVFSNWKRIANDAKETDDVIGRRFKRRHRHRHLRSLFSSWLEVMETCESKDLERRATEHHHLQTRRNVFLSWLKSRRTDHRNLVANIRTNKLKQAFVGWLLIKRGDGNKSKSNEDDSCPHEEMAAHSPLVVEEYQTGIKQTITPDKHSSGKPLKPKEDDVDALLIPVRSQRQKATTSLPSANRNPNHLLKMNQRKEEREKRREMLRRRYEQKAIERKQQQEEDRLKKEDAETRVQREYFASKVTAEQKKKLATARWKRAWHLAVLHYQRSLQQRLFKKFRLILQIQAFNHRKAWIAWTDSTYEKYWTAWLAYKNDQQRQRTQLYLKHHELADDFNKRRLLAKAFALLEDNYTYQKSRLVDASNRKSKTIQRSVITDWNNLTINCIAQHNAIENRAKRNRRRLTLLFGFQCWHSSVKIAIKERELNALVEEKWKEVYKWLDTD